VRKTYAVRNMAKRGKCRCGCKKYTARVLNEAWVCYTDKYIHKRRSRVTLDAEMQVSLPGVVAGRIGNPQLQLRNAEVPAAASAPDVGNIAIAVTKAGNTAGARSATGSSEAVPPICASVVSEAEHARVCAALIHSEEAKEKMALLIKTIEIKAVCARKRRIELEGTLTGRGRGPWHWPF
jgi:hypothetical protein